MRAADLAAPFAEFVAEHGGRAAVAWAPVGAPDHVQVLGSTTDRDAWSTIKVPIAVAALNAADDSEVGELQAQAAAAIERSDNRAAAVLWRSLGTGAQASDAVEGFLALAGDPRTEVGEDAVGEQRGFGRTAWSVADSARVASMLPCLPEAAFVYDEMAKIDKDHRWGMGAMSVPVRFKGGWGPSDHGYLVRQLGVMQKDGGQIALAMAVQPGDGRHETGTATADELARWLGLRLGAQDVGACPTTLP
ncbi:MAG: hypothetical protein Q4G43_00020 [Mobilicoccus sp.]|nr:hypothetical protein [Mobilicoccus sp.]